MEMYILFAIVFFLLAAIVMMWLTFSSLEKKNEPSQVSERLDYSRTHNSEYKMALLLSKLIAILGWIVFVIGIIMVVVGFVSSFNFGMVALAAGVIDGFKTSCVGLLIVVSGQMMRTQIDTADNTRKILISMNERKV